MSDFCFWRTQGAPPDLPSMLLNGRIVYIGMPLVAAVTELVVAQLLWLQYDNPEKPVYLYINSGGTISEDGQQRIGFETEAYAIAGLGLSLFSSFLFFPIPLFSPPNCKDVQLDNDEFDDLLHGGFFSSSYCYYNFISSVRKGRQWVSVCKVSCVMSRPTDTLSYIRNDVHTIAVGKCWGQAAMILGSGKKGKRHALPNASIKLQVERETGVLYKQKEPEKEAVDINIAFDFMPRCRESTPRKASCLTLSSRQKRR